MTIDKLDLEILREIARLPHEASISEILKPFEKRIGHSSFYERIWNLARLDLIKAEKYRHYVFVAITERGQEAQSKEDRTS